MDMFAIDHRSHEPVYQQLRRQIQEKIERQEFKVGEQVPSIRELVGLTKLSYVSVAKAVAELIREGILERQRGRGAFVAKRRKTPERRTGVIGISGQFMDRTLFADPYYSCVMRGVEPVLNTAGRAMLFHTRQEPLSATFKGVLLDGLLLFGPCLRTEAQVRDVADYPCPVVVIGQSVRNPDVSYVDSDNLNDSMAAVETLIESGRRRIAIVASPGDFSASQKLRYQGYQLALSKHNLAPDSCLVLNPDDIDHLAESVLKLKPDALFDTSNVARPLVGRLLKGGCRVPEDVALLVYDDYHDQLGELGVPYAVLRQPAEEIGRRAAELVMDLVGRRVAGPVRLNLRSLLVHCGKS